MKIVVIGGSGLIGTQLVKNLAARGHEVLAASPGTGVNTITREGLAAALDGAEVVVDVANAPVWEDEAVLEFFETSGRNLLAAEAAAGVRHHVALSIVGSERLPDNGYFRAKLAQERLVKASGIPYTILRATQFFEFVGAIAQSATVGGAVRLSPALIQPIASQDVAAELADVAVAAPLGATIEVAGPEAMPLDELVRRFLRARLDARKVVPDVHARYFGGLLSDRSLTPGENARIGAIRFEDWLGRAPAHVDPLASGGARNGAAGRNKARLLGVLLCMGAVAAAAAGWFRAQSSGETSTDNAYVRGDVTSLAPRVAGYVTDVEVEDNQAVRAGDVLFRIDDRDYRARLAQATANVEAARARLANVDAEIQLQQSLIRQAEAQSRSNLAELDLAARISDRRRQLVRRGFVSPAQQDESDAAQSRAEAGVSAALALVAAQRQRIAVLASQRTAAVAAVEQAQAARELAEIDLDSTVVRAPLGGIVGNRQVRVGRLVAPGASLLNIVPVNELWVVANFKETQLGQIRPGLRARITIDGLPDQVFEGVVDSFAPGSGSTFSMLPPDNATGNFVRVVQRVPVKIRFVHAALPVRLVPGLSARVRIAGPARS